MQRFALNDSLVEVAHPSGMPALDFLREHAGLTGVKHACREGDCGSCAVLVGEPDGSTLRYRVVTSCLLPLGALTGRHVVTIEGLNRRELGPIQSAFVAEGASQCGFCTPGFVVSLVGHLLEAEVWDDKLAEEAVAGNICRCTGYASIQRAIHRIIDRLRQAVEPGEDRVPALVREGFLPDYFLHAGELLAGLGPPAPIRRRTEGQRVVAGGTDLYVQRPDELAQSEVFLVAKREGPPIWEDGGHVYLAASATAEDIKRSRLLARAVGGLDRAMELMGSLPIRSMATIGGNLVNASPIGDMTIILLALDAEICLVDGDARRTLPLRLFFRGYKDLDLQPGEIVEWARFPAERSGCVFAFEKVSKRTHLDIASVNTALSLRLERGRIASACVSAGGVAPVPLQLQKTSAFLEGRKPDVDTARGAAALARSEVRPISDVRGSADYKRLLLGQLVLAHFHVLFNLDEDLIAGAAS